ncbi:MAG: hypothetical protein IJA85_03645 [Clostridia bacterium]|nr:hypothetical protein [Clostridia bacterium]
MKKIISVLLLCAMLCSAFASCASEDEGKTPASADATTASDGVVTEAGTETKPDYLGQLEAIDYGGRDYNILCRDSKIYEVWAEAEMGETINDAIFRRNKAVEEKYKVVINKIDSPGDWGTQEDFKSAVKRSVQGQDGAYDLVAGYLAYTSTLAMEGMFYNLYDIDTIDLSNIWWTQGFVENNTIENCLFTTVGDISLTMWEGIYALYFNKQLALDNNVGDLYQMVKDKTWTQDTFEGLVKQVSSDIDGDSQYTNEDLYGFVTNRHSLRALITTSNIPIATRNDEGTYDLVYYGDKVVALYERIYAFINEGNNVFFSKPTDDADYTEMMDMFLENRGLFISGTLDNTTTLRQMDTDFGILPFPLYDANQENYISHSYDGLSVFGIPSSVKDPECSGAILEALGAESKASVIPDFYETVLKGKVARDNDSEAMLDLIRDALYFDFGFVHAVSINGLFQFFGDKLQEGTENFASAYEKQSKVFNKAFEKVLDAYMKVTG